MVDFDRDYKILGTPISQLSDEELVAKIKEIVGVRTVVPEKPRRVPSGQKATGGKDLTDVEEI